MGRGRGSAPGRGRGGGRNGGRSGGKTHGSNQNHHVRGRGRGRGRGGGGTSRSEVAMTQLFQHAGRQGLGTRNKRRRDASRGGSMSVKMQNKVPLDYRSLRGPQERPEAALDMARDIDEEEDEESDVPIEPHKVYSKRDISQRRKLEGILVDEMERVVTNKKYDFNLMLRSSNPLRRPVIFVKATGEFGNPLAKESDHMRLNEAISREMHTHEATSEDTQIEDGKVGSETAHPLIKEENMLEAHKLSRDEAHVSSPPSEACNPDNTDRGELLASVMTEQPVESLDSKDLFVIDTQPDSRIPEEQIVSLEQPTSRRRTRKTRRGGKKKHAVRQDSDIEWGSDGPPLDEGDDFLSLKPVNELLMASTRKPVSEQDAILADWLENAILHSDSEDVQPGVPGMPSDPYGAQDTLEDIASRAHDIEQEAWMSGDEDEESDEVIDLSDDTCNNSENDSFEEQDDLSETDIFDSSTHADLLNKVPVMTKGKLATQSKLDTISTEGLVPSGKRRNKPQFSSEDLWAKELQAQWERDRSKKSAKKKARAAARQMAALNPYPNSHKTGSTQSKSNKERKREKRSQRATLKMLADQADGDMSLTTSINSFAKINAMIESFLADTEHSTLTLPSMRKHDRAMVHNLANAYSLKSKSRGKGVTRFPILYKTSRSGQSVDHRRVSRLLHTPFGVMEDDMFDHRGLGRSGPRATVTPRPREGTRVGGTAKKITQDNIGHRLLQTMGWSDGQGLGRSEGRAEPVVATIKVTRSGLGR